MSALVANLRQLEAAVKALFLFALRVVECRTRWLGEDVLWSAMWPIAIYKGA